MCHRHWKFGVFQDKSSRTTWDSLSRPAVGIGAHHQKIGPHLRRLAEQGLTDTFVITRNLL